MVKSQWDLEGRAESLLFSIFQVLFDTLVAFTVRLRQVLDGSKQSVAPTHIFLSLGGQHSVSCYF
jgi:hypothetical protein